MVEHLPSKQDTRVRFPPPAPLASEKTSLQIDGSERREVPCRPGKPARCELPLRGGATIANDLVHIQEINKFNPYHDRLGRFTTADGAASGGSATGKYLKRIQGADSLDALDEIMEAAANDDTLTNEEYTQLYSQALSIAQSW